MNRQTALCVVILASFLQSARPQAAGQKPANYDEARVPAYSLPDPLLTVSGKEVTTPAAWVRTRRPEILRLFQTHVYGRSPGKPARMPYQVFSEDPMALGGKATRRQLTLHFFPGQAGGAPVSVDVLMYVPNGLKVPAPAFLGLNFNGNQSVHADPGIRLSTAWVRNNPKAGIVANRVTEAERGAAAGRWQVEKVISRGYALVTACYGDIDPDFDDGFRNGVHPLFYRPGQVRPGPDEWGSIGAWAWGLSRILDYLEQDRSIDARRVAVLGHSRLGKTALWAGAQDERFAIVISNDSGCGGAALSRRKFGETVERINTSFPHWFCENFRKYNDHEDRLPVDQHMLISLVAPRPVYVASAAEDLWADPRGEFLSAKGAGPVYALFGKVGVGVEGMPAVDSPVGDFVGYHVRTGGHDVKEYDWDRYLDFADRHMKH